MKEKRIGHKKESVLQDRELQEKKRRRRVYLMILFINLIVTALFLFGGVTAKNFSFYMPRRITKVITIWLVSFCVGYSGVTFQTITNNRILTPGVMGLDSLYMFIQTVVVFFFGGRKLTAMTGYPNFLISVGAMVLASLLLYVLLFHGDKKNVYFLVMTGMVFGTLFGGLTTFMQVMLDPNEFAVLEGKMFASFNHIRSDLLGISSVIIFIIIILTRKDDAYYNALSLGHKTAINLGVNYQSLVRKSLLITAVLISISTVLVGPITFLGISVVSLSRELLKTYRQQSLTFCATIFGATMLITGIYFTERVFHFTTTLSVIINFIGGIYFIFLLIKERAR